MAAKIDGSPLGKHRVQVRSVTCKNGSIRHIAWVFTELPLPAWSKCWVGLDVTDQREVTERHMVQTKEQPVAGLQPSDRARPPRKSRAVESAVLACTPERDAAKRRVAGTRTAVHFANHTEKLAR